MSGQSGMLPSLSNLRLSEMHETHSSIVEMAPKRTLPQWDKRPPPGKRPPPPGHEGPPNVSHEVSKRLAVLWHNIDLIPPQVHIMIEATRKYKPGHEDEPSEWLEQKIWWNAGDIVPITEKQKDYFYEVMAIFENPRELPTVPSPEDPNYETRFSRFEPTAWYDVFSYRDGWETDEPNIETEGDEFDKEITETHVYYIRRDSKEDRDRRTTV